MSDPIHTRYEMRRASYEFKSTAVCKGRGAAIEWWLTTNKKMMPFDPIADDFVQAIPHWSTCPKRDNFKPKPAATTQYRDAREKGVATLLETTRARAVIALYDDGKNYLSWRNGIPAENLKHEAITAANRLRDQIVQNGGQA